MTIATVTISGTTNLLFHPRRDDSLPRDGGNVICLPGDHLVGSIAQAARYRQDPRSPRKSAADLFRTGVVALTDLAPIISVKGSKVTEPDYLDQRRVVFMDSEMTRSRPAFTKGWSATVRLAVSPHIDSTLLHEVLIDAGRLIGLADFRPTYGRFAVTDYHVDSVESAA